MALYTVNIPQPGDFPSDSQPQLLGNNNYLLNVAGKGLLKDHQMTLDTANANDGIHKQVTLANEATPGFAGGNSVVYANTANGQSQLFFDNGTVNTQLTVTKTGVPATLTVPSRMVSFLPGGYLIQCGIASVSNGTVVTFPVAFSAIPIAVTFTPANNVNVVTYVAATTAGSWTYGKSTSGVDNVYWVAIGPA